MPVSISTSETPLGDLALRAAWAAVDAIKAVQAGGALAAEYKSGAHDLVTAADKSAEEAVLRTILSARPDDAVLGEETGAHPGTSGTRWLIDPLDGTANFVHGRSDYAVSVGVEVDGRITAGAVIRPASGRWAMAEDKTFVHGTGIDDPDGHRPLAPSSSITAEALVSFGLPYPKSARQQALALIQSVVPIVRGIRVIGSAASDLLAVALGECDVFVGCGLAPWDTAAGQAIAVAAGAAVERITASPFEILLVGPLPVIAELAATVRDVFPVPG